MTETARINGTVMIKRGGVFFAEKDGHTEFEVVAAKLLGTHKNATAFGDSAEWRLELGDGSTVQWTMDLSKYGQQFLAETLNDMPSERPKEVESRYAFGVNPEEIAAELLRLGNGIGASVLPQAVTRMAVAATEDFEIRMITLVYAEKRA